MPVETDAVVSPCDGTVSQIGTIDGAALLQAQIEAKRLRALHVGLEEPHIVRRP